MRRTYVIGDIHGYYSEFKQLLDLCSDDAEGRPAQLILLGATTWIAAPTLLASWT
jgi:hypothetical protein